MAYAGNMATDDYPEPLFWDSDDEPLHERRVWTGRRIFMLVIALLVIVSFVTVFYLSPLISAHVQMQHPLPTPTMLPRF